MVDVRSTDFKFVALRLPPTLLFNVNASFRMLASYIINALNRCLIEVTYSTWKEDHHIRTKRNTLLTHSLIEKKEIKHNNIQIIFHKKITHYIFKFTINDIKGMSQNHTRVENNLIHAIGEKNKQSNFHKIDRELIEIDKNAHKYLVST